MYAQDDATPTQHVTQQFSDTIDVKLMEWPTRSHGMNSSQHVWDKMGVWIRDMDGPLPLCQNCGVVSSMSELQFTQEGWGPCWAAWHVVCVLFSSPDGVTQGSSSVATLL